MLKRRFVLIFLMSFLVGCGSKNVKVDPIINTWYASNVNLNNDDYDPIEFNAADFKFEFKEDSTFSYIEEEYNYIHTGTYVKEGNIYSFDLFEFNFDAEVKDNKLYLYLDFYGYDTIITCVEKNEFEKYRNEYPASLFESSETFDEDFYGGFSEYTELKGYIYLDDKMGIYESYPDEIEIFGETGVYDGQFYFEVYCEELDQDYPLLSTYVEYQDNGMVLDPNQEYEDQWFLNSDLPDDFIIINVYDSDKIAYVIKDEYIDDYDENDRFSYIIILINEYEDWWITEPRTYLD